MINQENLKNASKEAAQTIQLKLAEKMLEGFELVVSDRSGYFAKNPDKIPDLKSVPSIIKAYSMTNAAISGGSSLVPGPWGMVAVVPEIVAVFRNQLAMIYDIGVAYGKGNILTRELLAGVLLTALGTGTGAILVMQGSKVLVKRVTLRAFQKIIMLLAGRITQQALKSAISKWLPVFGAAAMAVWSNYLTQQTGNKAVEILEKEIVFSDEVSEEVAIDPEDSIDTLNLAIVAGFSPDMPKVQTLINLIKVDNTVADEERYFIQTIIDAADLTESEKDGLRQAVDRKEKFTVDYSTFKSSPDDAIALIVDLVTLAKRDNVFHVTERMFIRQIGKILGFSDTELEDAMAVGI